jgi:hypothetical protein
MAIGVIAPTGKWTGWDNDGNPAIGGLLYTYTAGTTTNLATYTDVALSVPNTNPVVLDSAGRATIYLTPLAAYKFVLKNALGTTLWTQDNITVAAVSDAVTRIIAGTGITITSTGAETGRGDVTITKSSDPAIASLATNEVIIAASATQLGRVAVGLTGEVFVGVTGAAPDFAPTLALTGGAGAATVTIPATGRIYLDGGGNTWVEEGSADTVQIVCGGTTRLTINTVGTTVLGTFGCNGAAAQAPVVSGGALVAYAAGGLGLANASEVQALHALVVAMRAALVANGIMS